MIKIDDIILHDDYRIQVRFDNGEVKICDLAPFLDKGDFCELKEKSMFNTIRVIRWGVEWANGLDLSADTLDAIGKSVNNQSEIAV